MERIEVREGAVETARSRGLLRGVLETLSIVVGFVVVGVAWASAAPGLGGRDEASGPLYPAWPMESEDPSVWLVDGYNVLHAGVLGGRDRSEWWTEPRRQELIERAARFDSEVEIWIVFDGPEDPASAPVSETGPRCVFAPSADDWLIEQVRRSDQPGRIAVVTADRRVAGRSRGCGACVVSPKAFLARCGA
jgi:predicted RNA-binding protein with PIN domain